MMHIIKLKGIILGMALGFIISYNLLWILPTFDKSGFILLGFCFILMFWVLHLFGGIKNG